MKSYDVLVVGAGIVGAACALALQDAGLRVGIVDAMSPGAGVTAAGMGHLVALDENAAELDLCLHSLGLWRGFLRAHPGVGEASHCGTLWVAENEHQLEEAHQRAARLCARAWQAEALNGDQVQRMEPALRRGLCGGVQVKGDSVVYPPAVAHFIVNKLLAQDAFHAGVRVESVSEGCVQLENGVRLKAKHIIVAAGVEVARLLPAVPVFPRKGHLAITDRYPGQLSQQIVSMNYGQSAAGPDALAVAANIQPRITGQWLIGSCRQDQQTDTRLDPAVLGQVLAAAIGLLPCLATMRIIRAWAGMRPASPDGLPLIGAYPGQPGLWLAAGHEGLGVTTAFGTASLLASQILGQDCAIDPAPYDPARLIRSTHGI